LLLGLPGALALRWIWKRRRAQLAL
jgi:hypothetical protein